MPLTIKALTAQPRDLIQEYFQVLHMYDLLKDRFYDTKNPTWSDVIDIIKYRGPGMFFIFDTDREVECPIAEFTIDFPTGKVNMIHFSVHPDLPWSDVLKVMRFGAWSILTQWKRRDGSPYALALTGLTPLRLRAACISVLRSGFTKIGVIPGSAYFANEDIYADCQLSLLTREEVLLWEEGKEYQTGLAQVLTPSEPSLATL